MKRILVLTDFSPASERAERQAERLALALGAEIQLLHKVVYPAPVPPSELLDRLDDSERFDDVLTEVLEQPEREARETLEARAERLRSAGIPVTTHLERSGEAFDCAERAIATLGPDLLVMGTHGRSGIRKFLMGSVAEKVLRHADIDVLTLREDASLALTEKKLDEVLVPTDFSFASRRALDAAFRWTRDLSGSVCLLHVMEPRFSPRGEGFDSVPLEVGAALQAEALDSLRRELGEREGVTLLAEGDVASTIERFATERSVSLVIQGSHGRGRFQDVFLGSVAEKVARSSRFPVLTVR
jgi:nucleotide-binding universal stress UspA family protein